MTITKKFSEITSYQGDNFKNWFDDMPFKEEKTKLFSKTLEKPMNDKEILDTLKPTEVSLGEVFNHLTTEARKEDWMIFYCKDKADVLRAVDVSRYGDGWNVSADSVEDPVRWRDGRRVFSRNSFDSETLSPSNPLTLESAIKVVK